MGLELKMFEGSVPSDLLCAFCGRVLVQPEMSSCQHAFCSECLRTQFTMACPTCGTWLEMASRPAPAQIKMRLLDLRIRCDHKCGQVLTLANLPEHVASECPNTPVPCEYVSNGCKKKVRRCELAEHCDECDFRPVVCDACGHKTLFKDLFVHQTRTRCVEMRIKNQLIQAVRSTHKDVKRHQKHLERQQVRLDQQNRRTEIEHFRRMTTARRHRQRQQNYNLPEENSLSASTSSLNGTSSGLPLAGLGNISSKFEPIPTIRLSSRENSNLSTHRHIASRERGNQSTQRALTSRESGRPYLPSMRLAISREKSNEVLERISLSREKFEEQPVKIFSLHDRRNQPAVRETASREKTEKVSDNQQHSELFLTAPVEDDLAPSSTLPSKEVHCCKNCKKPFRVYLNKANSCRWHAGPIIELFGGTCYSCGRLDYQNGCMMGFHEM